MESTKYSQLSDVSALVTLVCPSVSFFSPKTASVPQDPTLRSTKSYRMMACERMHVCVVSIYVYI